MRAVACVVATWLGRARVTGGSRAAGYVKNTHRGSQGSARGGPRAPRYGQLAASLVVPSLTSPLCSPPSRPPRKSPPPAAAPAHPLSPVPSRSSAAFADAHLAPSPPPPTALASTRVPRGRRPGLLAASTAHATPPSPPPILHLHLAATCSHTRSSIKDRGTSTRSRGHRLGHGKRLRARGRPIYGRGFARRVQSGRSIRPYCF